ncbi:phosphoglycerate kinase [Candidatus Dependentiae bacterium Noda2021]|nr:phosphoglycerate kinase [Candidatus Dependentiae bacterium Noda2021]
MLSIPCVQDIDVAQTTVLFRVDLNVPIVDNQIENDFRLRSITKTLDYLIAQKATVILVTHMGDPKKNNAPSTRVLLTWFYKNGYSVVFAPDLDSAHALCANTPPGIIMLENIRLFAGEQNNDPLFAQRLADLADCYVSDAFGAMHRTDSSLVTTPTLFARGRKAAGFLVQAEIKQLDALKHPEKPLTLVLGGAKPATKIPLIKEFLNKADYILLCPALVFSFLAARHQQVGRSLIDRRASTACNDILKQAEQSSTKVVMPIDYLVSDILFKPPFRIVDAQKIGDQDFGLAIGPQTMRKYAFLLKQSKTIFLNGIMGDLAYKESLDQTHSVLNAMISSGAKTVVAGGDSVGALYTFNLQDKIGYVSTGGGAALAYLAGQELPGLLALLS